MSATTLTTDLLMYKDLLYFGTADHHILGIEPDNGKSLVQMRTREMPVGGIGDADKDSPGEFEFSYSQNTHTGHGALSKYADEFDRVVWSADHPKSWSSDEPLSWKGLLIAGDCDGNVFAYRVQDGVVDWRTHVDGCVSTFAHDEHSLYITVREGALYSYEPPD